MNNTIIDIGELSKPLTKLTTVVAAGVGRLYEPIHVVRMAKAEARADIAKRDILAAGEFTLEQRARMRIESQDFDRQRNLEDVVRRAAIRLPVSVSDDAVNPDWTRRFLRYSQEATSDEIREAWARLLATEVTQPGAVSKRTLSVFDDLAPGDATLFSRVASLVWVDDDQAFLPMLAPVTSEHEYYSFDEVLQLADAGLIHASTASLSFTIPTTITCGGRRHSVRLHDGPGSTAGVPVYLLTSSGRELLAICDLVIQDGWMQACIERFRFHRYDVLAISSIQG